MSGDLLTLLTAGSAGLWLAALVLTLLRRDAPARTCQWAGWLMVAGTIATLWLTLGRPPLRTLGETRLWYALSLGLIGGLLEPLLATRTVRAPMLALGLIFLVINLLRPGTLDRTLMPALVSPWFVPHVAVYLAAYAILGLAAMIAAGALLRSRGARPVAEADADLAERLAWAGLPFLTCGLVFGAVWAKGAWGHYWAWDPKETWALLTWIAYVAVLHQLRHRDPAPAFRCAAIALAFVVVLACWFALNWLPAAQASVHTYARD